MNNQLFLCMSVRAQLLAFFHAFSTQSLLPTVESSKFYGWIQHKLSKQTFTVEACTEIGTHAKRGVSLTALHTSTSILVGCILSWNRELLWLSARLLFLLPCYFPSWLSSATRLTTRPHTNTLPVSGNAGTRSQRQCHWLMLGEPGCGACDIILKKNIFMDQVFIHCNTSPSFSRFSLFKLWENKSLQTCTII